MSVQISANAANLAFIKHGMPAVSRTNQTIAQDAGRSAALAPFTLMAKVAASGKWTPFIDETATDGTAIPQGIYIGSSIAAATLVAGDVSNVEILTGNAIYDKNLLVIEASKTLDTVITVGTTDLRTVRDQLANRNLYDSDSIDVTEYENS